VIDFLMPAISDDACKYEFDANLLKDGVDLEYCDFRLNFKWCVVRFVRETKSSIVINHQGRNIFIETDKNYHLSVLRLTKCPVKPNF